MNIYCTVSDYKYLVKGVALYQSLEKHNESFKLYYLAIDNEAYSQLLRLKSEFPEDFKFLMPISIYDLHNEDIKHMRKLKASKYGDAYSQFCWALTPYFTNWCLLRFVEEGNCVYYVDSDLYFYDSITEIQKELGEKSIGIISHRGPNGDVGEFNVGIVVFRNSEAGRECSKLWKDWLIDENNPYYVEYGTCGDQKYLELFPKLFFSETVVLDKTFHHFAPWNADKIDYKLPLVFAHYSHFNMTLNKSEGNYTWASHYKSEWQPENQSERIRICYREYAEISFLIIKKYGLDL